MAVRSFALAVALFGSAVPAFAQTVTLGERVKPGDHFRCELALTLTGKMKVDRDGKVHPLTLTGEATHRFVERIESADAAGAGQKSVRHYEVAKSAVSVAGDPSRRELPAARRLTVAARTDTGTRHACPAGPLTQDELELVGEHFDTLALPALLPNKELKVGDSWPVAADAVLSACLFEGLLKNDLTGTLTAVKDGVATFTVTGTAEGMENGAVAKLTVKAAGTFDVAAGRVTALTWEQGDDRDQGPVSPATEVTATVTLKRTPLAAAPKELSAEARAAVPAGDIPADMTRLRYADPDGKYAVTYPREWVIVGRTPDHLVMRRMEKGEFTGQVTVTGWKKVEAGRATPPAEFKAVLARLTTWEPAEVLADEEQPVADGRRVYRLAAKGKQDGAAVVQTFYLLTGPAGDQVAVTALAAPDKAQGLAKHEAELLNGFTFPGKK